MTLQRLIAVLSITIIILFSPSAPPLRAEEPVQLYLRTATPPDSQFENVLVVEVYLTGMVDLYGADIQLRYDPGHLQVQDAKPELEGVQISLGPLLFAGADQFTAANNVSPETGVIEFAVVLLPPGEPVSGEGRLATITFDVLEPGPVSVEVVNAELVSSSQTLLPVTTHDLTISVPPTPSTVLESVPNWAWWFIPLVVLLLTSLLLFVFRLSQVKRAPAPTPGASSKIPGRRPNLGQSATLLARQGHQALTQGNEQKAHDLFNRAIELDPANAEAWLGKGLAAQEVTEKRLCFQRTLALEPDNQLAQKELKALEKIG